MMISCNNKHHQSIALSGNVKLVQLDEFLEATKGLEPFYNSDNLTAWSPSNTVTHKYKSSDGSIYIHLYKDCYTFSFYKEGVKDE